MDSTLSLVGVDFSSAPTRRKPITLAFGRRAGQVVLLERLHHFDTLAAFGDWLAQPGPWLGAFDLPFGLPRELVQALDWPQEWPALMAHYAALTRAEIRATFAAFCAARPAGAKFAHRACDGPAGSSPSMKWVNPPVAFMLHAGIPLLQRAGVDLPRLHAGDPTRVALEAYPGLLARELIGRRSYKADDKARQTDERLIARKDLIEALVQGRSRPSRSPGRPKDDLIPSGDRSGICGPRGEMPLRLKASHALRDALVQDASGDRLDAVLCLVQAAWALGQPDYGLPADADPLEGWIVSALRTKG